MQVITGHWFFVHIYYLLLVRLDSFHASTTTPLWRRPESRQCLLILKSLRSLPPILPTPKTGAGMPNVSTSSWSPFLPLSRACLLPSKSLQWFRADQHHVVHSTLGSSIYVGPSDMKSWILHQNFQAPAESQIREKYHVNATVTSLGLSFYVLGFAFGPLLCTYYSNSKSPPSDLFLVGGKLLHCLTAHWLNPWWSRSNGWTTWS